MRLFLAAVALVLVALASLACGGGASTPTATPTSTIAPPTATATPSPATPTQEPTAPPAPVRLDLQATRLQIPALAFDAPVGESQKVPYVDSPRPGCPARPDSEWTLTVPNQGIVTPVENIEGLENKAWIFGHSRWQGQAGLFLGLQDLDAGDELILDGIDRATGESLSGRRFVVESFYLTDLDSGGELIEGDGPEDIPDEPLVILQTSVREDGEGKAWILDRERLLAKAENLVEGDLDDPCKYLLLYVTARPA